MQLLAGKAIVITGAGRGLGAAYARLAATHGAAVVVNDVDGDTAEEVASAIVEAGGRAIANHADIADWAGAGTLIADCVSHFGRIDGLCNNAAIFSMASPVEQDPQLLRRMIEVNLLGTAYVGMHAIRHMIDRGGGGAIVNTVSGAQSGSAGSYAYSASKGAVASLTFSWALDLVPHDIRVNAVSPQAQTRTALSINPDTAKGKTPEMNAPVAIFLLSDLAARVNGQILFINGSEIALITHPAILEPSIRQDDWTVETLAEAFAAHLQDKVLPIGRSRQSVTVIARSKR